MATFERQTAYTGAMGPDQCRMTQQSCGEMPKIGVHYAKQNKRLLLGPKEVIQVAHNVKKKKVLKSKNYSKAGV